MLAGWGRTAPSAAIVSRPGAEAVVTEILASGGGGDSSGSHRPRGVIARGLGRSYGDAAQRAGGVVIDTGCFDSIGPIEPATGLVAVGGGASLDELIRRALPLGWFPPVSPGTRYVTVGGAIAADVHGKNHHRDGSFCSHLTGLTLVTPTGTRSVSPETDAELFWATAGGMGLTGVVIAATIRMTRVETSWLSVDTGRFDDLDDVMAVMEASDDRYRYSVAWVDCSPRRGGLGRSVLTRGDHAPPSALGSSQRKAARAPLSEPRLRVPLPAPRGLVNRWTVRGFNELWFRRSPRRECGALQPLGSFFYPLDGLGDWNLLYGRGGLLQYQFVVPAGRADVVRRAVAMTAEGGVPSSLAVLKRFGPADPGPLSFPLEGWTLALDFAVGPPELASLLDRLDELVAAAGGRVYLAKDARLRPELLAVMYPRIPDLANVRRRVDPDDVLRSDLSQRLGLDGEGLDG
ncbi:MAG TPA: FAD-binding oxidoreductase [Acidimicrobiales bacterium]|nr:FAD-binding oxidoreductase [Acidimicrobiales bacterium]